jgi:hypothetical protein
MNHNDSPAELQTVLRSNLEDERRHREWMEQRISEL